MVGHNYAALQGLLAQKVRKPIDDEVLILKDNGFGNPDAWSDAARAIYTKMPARAAVQAKQRGTNH